MQLSIRLSAGVSTRRSVAGLIAKRAMTPSPTAKSQSAVASQSCLGVDPSRARGGAQRRFQGGADLPVGAAIKCADQLVSPASASTSIATSRRDGFSGKARAEQRLADA